MLNKFVKTALATTTILTGAALSFSSPSHADTGVSKLKGYTPSEITKVGVNASGTAYEMTGLMDIAASLQMIIDTEISGRVKSWKTWLKVRTENSSWVHFSNHAASKSYSKPRPKKVNTVASVAVPHMTLAPVMVSYCNAMADNLRGQGKSNQEIFSQDRTVPVAIKTDFSYEYTGLGGILMQAEDPSEFANYQKINLICKGRAPVPPVNTAGDIKPPPVDFKVQDIDLFLTTFSGANTQPNAATSCKKGQVKVRLKASKAGNAKFKLWTKVGAGPMTSKVINAEASFDGAGGYKAEYVEWVSVDKTSTLQAKAEEMVGLGLNTPWKDITLPCTDIGGGGLATNPNTSNPDQPNADGLPQLKTLKGDFSFVDAGSPKCIRKGKALLTFQSPKADNVHYSLDCKFDNYSGVIPVAPNPAGGYSGVALVSFDVEKTLHENCTLRTVAPYGPKEHVTKQHLFQCVTPSGHSASNNIQVDSNPPSSRPEVPAMQVPVAPHKVIVGTGTSQNPTAPWHCVGGKVRAGECKCQAFKKLIYTQVRYHGMLFSGSKCVLSGPGDKTTKPANSSVDAQIKAKADAVKRRLEVAKKAAIAKRKREAAAAKALKLKAARIAAIAKRKRDAAKKIAIKKAVAALRLRKARALKAAAAKRATAAILARRKATFRKRTVPSRTSIGTMTQGRVMRRR